ncbi:Hypothetical Protein FCC1311_025522 [Hondaea fermentalgiana]|uniref:Uncharacterized protein n=1 Tax=Hondaea fermentalgiana TaxID=2315210 RepID=A0A2R5GDQ2_9STRA|nr:Hypothetical Protein FCC1311_025522 [Hondaea fermentalgiana]|eukprot:GBG26331.1 Hypothetical Protein FCC1311_025522 [Hondaea fermentalgiana]
MPLEERVVQYASTAGALVTEPYDWEEWYGDAGERAARTGRNALAFKRYFANELLKLRKEVRRAYDAKRSAEDIHHDEQKARAREREERSQLVQQLGRVSLKLRGEGPGRRRGRRQGEKNLVIASDYANPHGDIEDGDSSEDEDWETDAWSKGEIEGAVDLLIAEIRGSPHAKRRLVATKMLRKLIRRHQMARDHVDLLMPSLVEKALFVDLTASRRTSETTRISQLIADVVSVLPEKMSRFACAEKASRILARKFQLAALVIQSWHRMRIFKQHKAHTMPLEFRVRRRAFLLVAFMDSLEQWTRFSSSPSASLALSDKTVLLRILCGLTADTNTYFRLKDRRLIVENGGVLAVQELALSSSQETRILAMQILTSLASEPCLRLGLLQSGVHLVLGVLLRSDLVEDRCMALEVADLLASATCFGETHTAWAGAWKRLYNTFSHETHGTTYENECRHEINLRGVSTFRRALRPELRVVDAAALLVDRRRDGGLLRWLREQLQANDGIVRLGATIALFKLASGVCNPQVASVAEPKTLHERHSGYLEKLGLRRAQFVQALVSNLCDTDTAGLQIATLQLIAQLSGFKPTRDSLMEAGLASRIRSNVRGSIGLFALVLLCSQSSRPIQLQDERNLDGSHRPEEVGASSLDFEKVDVLQRPALGIVELDIFASEMDFRRCLESTLVAFASLKPDNAARAAYQRLAHKFNAMGSLFDFLFTPKSDVLLDRIELSAVAAIILGRAGSVCGSEILSQIRLDHQFRRLAEPVHTIVKSESDTDRFPAHAQGLVVVSASSACQALCTVARTPARKDLVEALLRDGAVRALGTMVSQFAEDAAPLHKEVCCKSAELLGSLLPYQGLEKEASADLLSTTTTEAEKDEDEGLDVTDDAQQQRALISRARQNAKKAATQGVFGLGWGDVRSTLPSAELRKLATSVFEACGKELIRALTLACDVDIQASICYALSRLAGTHQGARGLLSIGCLKPIVAMLPGRSEVENGLPNAAHAQRLAMLPPSYFTLCAALARAWTGKLAMISDDVLRHAVDVLCLLSPRQDPRLHGEAALLVARVANVHDPVHGSCNEMVLRGRYNCAAPLLKLASDKSMPNRVRFLALLALAQLAQDELFAVPRLVRAGALSRMCSLVELLENRGDAEADMMLSQALRIIHALVAFMLGTHQGRLLEKGIEATLRRLASRKGATSGSQLAAQPTVREMARAVLDSLSLSLAFGPEVARQITVAPGLEKEEPLTREVLDEEVLRNDLTNHVKNPFGTQLDLGIGSAGHKTASKASSSDNNDDDDDNDDDGEIMR